MPAKTKRTITLRTLLGRLQNRCDLIVVEECERYWWGKSEYWQFSITRNELKLIRGLELVNSFKLNQPIKKGKGKTVKLKNDLGAEMDIGFFSLQNLIKWDSSVLK